MVDGFIVMKKEKMNTRKLFVHSCLNIKKEIQYFSDIRNEGVINASVQNLHSRVMNSSCLKTFE